MGLHEQFSKITSLGNEKELSTYIDKRFTTSFIGALDSIEHYLKSLFTEQEWARYWPPLREEILNKSNREKRLALKELEKYTYSRKNNFKKSGNTKSNYPSKERNFNR